MGTVHVALANVDELATRAQRRQKRRATAVQKVNEPRWRWLIEPVLGINDSDYEHP